MFSFPHHRENIPGFVEKVMIVDAFWNPNLFVFFGGAIRLENLFVVIPSSWRKVLSINLLSEFHECQFILIQIDLNHIELILGGDFLNVAEK